MIPKNMMNNNQQHLIQITMDFIERHIPHALTVFLSGSLIRGEGTSTSDLDIVILSEHGDTPYRESFIYANYPIEVFVHNETSLRKFFAKDIACKTPSLLRMCSEGVIVKDDLNISQEIKDEVAQLLSYGPPPLTSEEIQSFRYSITDLLEDLKGSQSTIEDYFIVPELMKRIVNFYLLFNRQWIGTGKWIVRSLASYNQQKAQDVERVLQKYYQSLNATGIIILCEDWLSEMGRLLFEGYKSIAQEE